VLAALNSVDPHVQNYVHLDSFHAGKSWVEARRPELLEMLESRLASLAGWLGDADYLEGRYTAADLVLCTVLREAVDCGVLARYPTLDAHRQRCEARPAFARAMADHLRPFAENAPAE
jgi:glutathione S-transferase